MELPQNSSAIYRIWCAPTFPPTFGPVTVFAGNFASIVAPASADSENYAVHLKEQSLVRNAVNLCDIGQLTAMQCLFEQCTHRTHVVPD